jgi:hypothetical protein
VSLISDSLLPNDERPCRPLRGSEGALKDRVPIADAMGYYLSGLRPSWSR